MRYLQCAKCGHVETIRDDERLGLQRPDGTVLELRCEQCRSPRVLLTTRCPFTRDDEEFLREIARGE